MNDKMTEIKEYHKDNDFFTNFTFSDERFKDGMYRYLRCMQDHGSLRCFRENKGVIKLNVPRYSSLINKWSLKANNSWIHLHLEMNDKYLGIIEQRTDLVVGERYYVFDTNGILLKCELDVNNVPHKLYGLQDKYICSLFKINSFVGLRVDYIIIILTRFDRILSEYFHMMDTMENIPYSYIEPILKKIVLLRHVSWDFNYCSWIFEKILEKTNWLSPEVKFIIYAWAPLFRNEFPVMYQNWEKELPLTLNHIDKLKSRRSDHDYKISLEKYDKYMRWSIIKV